VICDEQFNLRAVEWDQHRDRMDNCWMFIIAVKATNALIPVTR
jgi:hypothetical protein